MEHKVRKNTSNAKSSNLHRDSFKYKQRVFWQFLCIYKNKLIDMRLWQPQIGSGWLRLWIEKERGFWLGDPTPKLEDHFVPPWLPCCPPPPMYALLPLLILPHHTILSTILYLPLSTSGSFLFLSNVSPWFSYIHALLPNGRHLMLETFEVSPPIHGFFFLFPLIIDVWLHEKRNFVTYLCIYFLQ